MLFYNFWMHKKTNNTLKLRIERWEKLRNHCIALGYTVDDSARLELNEMKPSSRVSPYIRFKPKTRLGQKVIIAENISKSYDKDLFKNFSCEIGPKEKVAIIGTNGIGKTSLLKILTGETKPDTGSVIHGETVAFSVFPQEPSEILDMSQKAIDWLWTFAEPNTVETELRSFMGKMLFGSDDIFKKIKVLSGGEKSRLIISRMLMIGGNVLVLDEPTNHLDAETIDWLEMQLAEYPGTVIIVTHDRYFLDNITKWILELDGGHGIPWEGNYSSWLEQKLGKLSAGEKKSSPRKKAIERELAWIHMSNKNRSELTRNRLIDYEKLIAEEKAYNEGDQSRIQIAPGPELGEQVIEFKSVSKGFDEQLFSDLDFVVNKGMVVGLIGPNGTGKTTLFKMIAENLEPDSGEREDRAWLCPRAAVGAAARPGQQLAWVSYTWA